MTSGKRGKGNESALISAPIGPKKVDGDHVGNDVAPLVILDDAVRSKMDWEDPQVHGHFNDTASEGGFRGGGLNLRDYQKDIKKLRSENYDLKLRIYILEERHGLLPKPAEKENIYRINLDLKVENESMKKDLENKTQLLQEALEQIEEQERERLRDRQQFENQIESLRQTTMSTCTNVNFGDTFATNKPNNNEINDSSLSNVEIGERSKALLVEAFGSMNLGHSDDLLEKFEELQKACDSQKEEIQKLQEEKGSLYQEVTEKNELLKHESEMSKEVLEKFKELQNSWDNQKEDIKILQEGKENSVQKVTELKRKVSEFQLEVDEKERNIQIMEEQLRNIVAANESQNQAKSLEGVKILQLEEEITNLRTKLSETEARANVQISALKEVNFNKNESITVLEQRVAIREEALAKLREEYERVKDKVRKYREVKNASQDNHYVNEIEMMRSTEVALKSEIEQLKNHHTNNDINVAMKCAAKLALKEASKAYQKAATDYSAKMQDLLQLFHMNLRDVVEFLQHLLSLESKGQLDFSCLSDPVRNALQKSLDEGRRLSQISSVLEDVNETQTSFIGGDVQLPEFNLPNIEIKLNEEVIVGCLEQELQEDINANHAAAQAEIASLKVQLEECQMQLKNTQKGRKESDNQSYRTAKSLDSNSWSHPDEIVSQTKTGIKLLPHGAPSSEKNCMHTGPDTSSAVYRDEFTIQRLKAQILHLESRLSSQKEKADHDLEEAQSNLEGAKEQINLLKSEKNELIDKLEANNTEFCKNIASLQDELNHRAEENQSLVKKIQNLTKELKINSDAHEEMAQKVRNLNEQIELETEKCLNFSKTIKAQANQNKALKEEKKMLQNLMEQQERGVQQDANKLIKELEQENHELRAKLSGGQNQPLVEVSSISQEQEHEVAVENRRRNPFKEINNLSQDRRGEKIKLNPSCGCQPHIEELEKLLEKANSLYKENIEAQKECKAAMDKAIVKQIKKTNNFLKQVNLSSNQEHNFKS